MDISIIRGDTREINVSFVNTDGTPIDLTGGTVFLTVNSSPEPINDDNAAVEKSVTSFANPESGQATVILDSADTNTMTPGTYFYDLQFVSGVGVVISQPRARFNVIGDITRRTS
jgi:hypothetical protein